MNILVPPVAFWQLRPADAAVVGAYFVAVLGIGAWFKWRERRGDTEEFLLGSRGLPWWLVSVASFMTLISTSSLVSIPGEAYNHGVGLAFRSLIGPLLGIPVFYLCIRFFFAAGIFTPFSYLERRFDARTRTLASIMYLVIRVLYLSVTLYAAAKILEAAAGWPVWFSVLAIGGAGLAYVYLGGMKAVVWADFLQFFLLVAGLVLIAVVAMHKAGLGFLGVWQTAEAHGRGLGLARESDFWSMSPHVRVSFWLICFTALTDRLFYLSADQMAVQRLLSTKSYGEAARSNIAAMLLQVPVMLFLWFVGLAVFAFYATRPAEAGGIAGDAALFRFVATQLPVAGAGLFIAACLGAVMSTIDAGLHSLATVYLKDVHLVHLQPGLSAESQVRLSRLVIALIALLTMAGALFIGYSAPVLSSSFMEAQVFWITFQGLLAVWFIIGVVSTRVTGADVRRAFIAAIAVTLGTVVWYIRSRQQGEPVSFLFVAIPGELTMLVVGLLPGLWRKRLPAERIRNLTLFTLDRGAGTPGSRDAE